MTHIQAQRIVDKSLNTGETQERIAAARTQMLDTFISYSPAERATTWRAMDITAKTTLVSAMLIRKHNDWSQESIDLWIARYNQRWGS